MIVTETSIKNKKLSSGVECRFFPLGDKTGLKLYKNCSMANKTMRIQQNMFKLGVAPKVIGSLITLKLPTLHTNDTWTYREWSKALIDISHHAKKSAIEYTMGDEIISYYGYVTQLAETIESRYGWGSDDRMHYDEGEKIVQSDDGYDSLMVSMTNAGLDTYDIHCHNVGWIDGKMICIDFSHC